MTKISRANFDVIFTAKRSYQKAAHGDFPKTHRSHQHDIMRFDLLNKALTVILLEPSKDGNRDAGIQI